MFRRRTKPSFHQSTIDPILDLLGLQHEVNTQILNIFEVLSEKVKLLEDAQGVATEEINTVRATLTLMRNDNG